MRLRPLKALRATAAWRASGGSLFAFEVTYVVVNAVRGVAFDALALLPPAALGAWWVGVAPTPAADYDVTPDPILQFMLRYRMWAVLPVLLALTACAVVLRLGRRSTRRLPSGTAISVGTALPVYVAVFTAALFCFNEFFVPGSLAVRFGPMVIAVLYGWFVRRVAARTRLLAATRAGFRPPAGVLWSRRARTHLRRCVALSRTGRSGPPREALAAHAYFLSRGATEAAAWCAARAVDDALGAGRAADVELLFDEQDSEGAGWRREPAFLAAHGLFHRATGLKEEVTECLDAAQKELTARQRPVPLALRMLITLDRAETPKWRDRTRLRLVLGQRYAVVLRQLLALAVGLEDTPEEENGLRLARRIADLVTELGEPLFSTELTPVEALDLVAVRAEAYTFIGERLVARRRYREAVEPFTAAGELFQELAQPERSGLCAAWAVTACLLCGDARSALEEERLLDGLLHSLQRIEAPRGRLRDRQNRLGLAKARRDLADSVFSALHTGAASHPQRAAELALWLLESLNRNALSDAIRRGLRGTPEHALRTLLDDLDGAEQVAVSAERAAEANTPHPSSSDRDQAAQRARIMEIESQEMAQALFPELPDIRRVQSSLAGRVALSYRCHHDTAGWHIACVMVGPLGVRLHATALPPPPAGVPDGSTPHGLLTMLADTGEHGDHPSGTSGDLPPAAQVHTEIDFSRPVWDKLAGVLLPADLAGWLEKSSSSDQPAVLVVVPDGPLALVPFAGLRLAGSQPLAECATTVFVPSLSLITPQHSAPSRQDPTAHHAGPPPATGRVIAHASAPIFTERLTAYVQQAPRPVEVSTPANREELRNALLAATPDDVAVLFHHGDTAPDSASRGVRLADGGYLSATTARRWNWPGTVVLGSCWAAHLLPAEADEPFGLPTACLLAGARSVIGGQAPIAATKTMAAVIARVVVNSAQGERPAQVLGGALRTLSRTARGSTGPAADWAGLTCWTTDPPPAAHRIADSWTPWTSHSDAEQPDVHGSLQFDVLRKVSSPSATTSQRLGRELNQASRRALRYAQALSPSRSPVTTLALLAAINATDIAAASPWSSFWHGSDTAPPDNAVALSSQEAGHAVLAIGFDQRIVMSDPLMAALHRGGLLAERQGHDVIDPSHVVYGMAADPDCSAAAWLGAVTPEGQATVIRLLSDRVFGQDLPAPGSLGAGTPPPEAWQSSVGTPGPVPSAELHDWAAETAALPWPQHGSGTAGLLAHMTDRHDPALRAWAEAGVVVRPARQFEEARGGGVRVEVADIALTVTEAVADGLRRGTGLAHHLGHREVTSAHVLFCALDMPGTDAAARFSWDPVRPGPRAVLAAEVLGCVDIPLNRLPDAPPAEGPADPLDHPALLPVFAAAAVAIWLAPKALKFVVGIVVLLLLTATVVQHRAGKAMTSDTWLDAAAPRLTATVQGPGAGQRRPASMVGPLADSYVMPKISGLKAVAMETLFGDAQHPDTLEGHYLFLSAAAEGLPAEHLVRVRYRKTLLTGTEHCAGLWGSVFCLVDVRLPSSLRPHLTPWASYTYSASAGTPTAFLTPGQSRATPRVGQLYDDGNAGFSTRASDGTAPLLTTPVLIQQRGQSPELLGYVLAVTSDHRGVIVLSDIVRSYAQGLAQNFVGPVEGDHAFAGIGTITARGGLTVTNVEAGFSADVAGVREGDRITAADGRPIRTSRDLSTAVDRHRSHSAMTLRIVRGTTTLTATLHLGYRPIGS